jgi:hypothetical protein
MANTGKLRKKSTDLVRIKSMAEFVKVVCEVRDSWIEGTDYFDPWFRGQPNSSWPLEPNIFRYDLLNCEDEIRAEFQRRAPQYMTEAPPSDYWGWYFLMQHYGALTRLLDWTDSALVALFFALNRTSKSPEDLEDSVVWMLDPWWLNRTVFRHDAILLPDFDDAKSYLREVYSGSITPTLPAAIDPPFIARRVAVQRSHFTIFGSRRDALMQLGQTPGAHLIKLVIAKEAAPRITADLATLGVTDTSIYPDLKGLADELTRFQFGTWPPS